VRRCVPAIIGLGLVLTIGLIATTASAQSIDPCSPVAQITPINQEETSPRTIPAECQDSVTSEQDDPDRVPHLFVLLLIIVWTFLGLCLLSSIREHVEASKRAKEIANSWGMMTPEERAAARQRTLQRLQTIKAWYHDAIVRADLLAPVLTSELRQQDARIAALIITLENPDTFTVRKILEECNELEPLLSQLEESIRQLASEYYPLFSSLLPEQTS